MHVNYGQSNTYLRFMDTFNREANTRANNKNVIYSVIIYKIKINIEILFLNNKMQLFSSHVYIKSKHFKENTHAKKVS